jgi:hypothetical protein
MRELIRAYWDEQEGALEFEKQTKYINGLFNYCKSTLLVNEAYHQHIQSGLAALQR